MIFPARHTVDKGFPDSVMRIEKSLSVSSGVPVIISATRSGEFIFDFQKPENSWEQFSLSGFDTLQLGISAGNHPVLLNWGGSESPHFLFGGASGSGKSVGMIVAGMQVVNFYKGNEDLLKILVADPHNSIDAFDKSTHLLAQRCITGGDISLLLRYISNELAIRKSLGEIEVKRNKLPTILLIADELNADELIGMGGSNKENLAVISAIAKEGRKFNIRMFLGVQHPTESNIPSLAVNLPDRFIGRTAPNVSTAHLLGDNVSTSKLSGKGDFYNLSSHGLRRFIFAMPSAKDKAMLKSNNNSPHISKLLSGGNVEVNTDDYASGRPEAKLSYEILGKYLELHRQGTAVSYRMAQNEFGVSSRLHPRYTDAVNEILINLKLNPVKE